MVMGSLTPAMKQYFEVKNNHPDCIVFFRMGDFYETFFEDAKTVASALNITLTKRGKNEDGTGIPLAGIPYHALDNYLAKLIRQGYKVAICEQLEDPKLAKGLVKRGLTRIVTPGTVIEDNILERNKNNYIISVFFDEKNNCGIAAIDISTGVFLAAEIKKTEVINEIAKFSPAEIIIPMSSEGSAIAKELRSYCLNSFSDRHYVFSQARNYLLTHFKVNSLAGFGIEEKKASVSAAGALIQYLTETQKTALDYINSIRFYNNTEYMLLDQITIKNLELVSNVHNNGPCLLTYIDKTRTSMGGRMIRNWLLNPLIKVNEIRYRQEAVLELFKDTIMREELKELLTRINDIERVVSRLNYGNGNARDLLALSGSLLIIPDLKKVIIHSHSAYLKSFSDLDELSTLSKRLNDAIKEEPAATVREGNMIKKGYNSELDELFDLIHNSRRFISELEAREKERTGIKTLKIGFNNVFGYFFTVTNSNLQQIPADYIRKQTTVNGERFITEELKVLEEKILNAEDKINNLEYSLFMKMVENVKENTKSLQETAQKISELDSLYSLAQAAAENNYAMPQITDSYEITLNESRHPVIEKLEEVYIPNDVSLDMDNRTMIITGPNMAGKSTFMRQVALNVLLAQVGSFVPCKSAKIGIVDRIFTRVGANDDLTHGQSTFMVEMNEVSFIINNATSKSLIIMDEIGRGTSTFDGVAIAWSVAEYINKINAKTLFATHYHVLTDLDKIDGIKNYNIAVREDKDNIVFLRKIVPGGTDKSYGIHVAKLSGMPSSVIARAKDIQEMLNKEDDMKKKIGSTTKNTSKAASLNEWF
jgi:DNA mismatch repair protein MutS